MDRDYLGRAGEIGGYRVVVGDQQVRVLKDDTVVAERTVPPYQGLTIGQRVAGAVDLHLNWDRLSNGDEVIVISDGSPPALRWRYSVNVSDPSLSFWDPEPGIATPHAE